MDWIPRFCGNFQVITLTFLITFIAAFCECLNRMAMGWTKCPLAPTNESVYYRTHSERRFDPFQS